MPKCSRCKEDKPSSDFWKKKSRPNGLQPQCKTCSVESNREWRKQNPERKRELDRKYYAKTGLSNHRRRKYGATPEQTEELMARQNGLCAICKTKPAQHLDHDHVTGTIGEILCAQCNKGLGHFRDNPTLLREAADYVCRVRPLAENS